MNRFGHAVLPSLAALLAVCLLVSAGSGAYPIAPGQVLAIVWDLLWGRTDLTPQHVVFFNIRLPRLLLAVACGATLGVTGALIQGLFRNPLADPGLIGVSSGAALAAGCVIVLGANFLPGMPRGLGSLPVLAGAFTGGLGVTALIYLLAAGQGQTRLATLLLAGIAVNALAGAGLGFLSFLATDEQLRSLTFWLLGSLGGARWASVGWVLLFAALALVGSVWLAKPLDALALGEAQARLLGVPVEQVKRRVVWLVALGVGAITSLTGMIGFIGLVAPHLVRLVAGPRHAVVLPGSALLGAALVLAADSLARTVLAPAELPLGVLTAFMGAPFFLLLLRWQGARI